MDILAAQILPQPQGAAPAAMGAVQPAAANGTPAVGPADAFTALLAGLMAPAPEAAGDAREEVEQPASGGDMARAPATAPQTAATPLPNASPQPVAPQRPLLKGGLLPMQAASMAAPALDGEVATAHQDGTGATPDALDPATSAHPGAPILSEEAEPMAGEEDAPQAASAPLSSDGITPPPPAEIPQPDSRQPDSASMPGWAQLTIRPTPGQSTPGQDGRQPAETPDGSMPVPATPGAQGSANPRMPKPAAQPEPAPTDPMSGHGPTTPSIPVQGDSTRSDAALAATPVSAQAGGTAQPASQATDIPTTQPQAPRQQIVRQQSTATAPTAEDAIVQGTSEAEADVTGTATPADIAATTPAPARRADHGLTPQNAGVRTGTTAGKAADGVASGPDNATNDNAVASSQAEAAADQRNWRARARTDQPDGDQIQRATTAGAGMAAARPAPPAPAPELPMQGAAGAVQAPAMGTAQGAGTGGEQAQTGSGREDGASAEADTGLRALSSGEGSKPASSDFAQLLSPTRPGRPGHTGAAPHQIAVNIQRAVADGQDRLTLQLRPVDLGRIDVQLDFGKDGVLRAKVFADNASTLDMLQRDARGLERALNEAGLKTDTGGLSFSLRDQGGQARHDQDNQRGRGTAVRIAGVDGGSDLPDALPPTRILGPGRVDVRI